MKKCNLSFIVIIFFVSVKAKSLAVIDLTTIFNKDQKIAFNASNYIRMLIKSNGSFDVIDRKTTDLILKDQKFQYSKDCSDISCDVKKGLLLNVDYLITGAVNSIDNSYFMVLKLINLSSEELVGMVSKDIPKSSVSEMKSVVKELVKALLYDKNEILDTLKVAKRELVLNALTLETNPDSAEVEINGMIVGITPYSNKRILNGSYLVGIKKNNYQIVADSMKFSGKGNLNKTYKLEYSEAFKDSLRHEFFTKKGGKNTRRIVFGATALLSAGAGFLFDYLAMNESDKADEYVAEYATAIGDFENYKEKYYSAEKSFDQNLKYRNILYGISGGMLLGFFISIPF